MAARNVHGVRGGEGPTRRSARSRTGPVPPRGPTKEPECHRGDEAVSTVGLVQPQAPPCTTPSVSTRARPRAGQRAEQVGDGAAAGRAALHERRPVTREQGRCPSAG